MIFSTRALIYTAIGLVIGLLFKALFNMMGLNIVGLIFMVILAAIGFAIGTFKIPENDNFYITRQCGGSNIDDVIKRAVMFYFKRKVIYIYAKEENKNDDK